jgi:hypothetical protein
MSRTTEPRAPAVRVSAAKDFLDFVEQFEPGARAEVLRRFPPESREAFELSPRSSWLALEHDHFVVDGVIAVLGKERALECWRDSVPEIVNKPLLRNFVAGMVRIFGREPARVLGLLPRAWLLIYRDLCTVSVRTDGPLAAIIRFEDITDRKLLQRPRWTQCLRHPAAPALQ